MYDVTQNLQKSSQGIIVIFQHLNLGQVFTMILFKFFFAKTSLAKLAGILTGN